MELHRRFAFPVACLMLAMVGIPLGIATRKGGKSAAYLMALFLGFFCYWLASMRSERGQQKTLSVPVAIWLPNAVFGIAGLVFLIAHGIARRPRRAVGVAGRRRPFRRAGSSPPAAEEGRGLPSWRIPLLPQIVDTYVLSNLPVLFRSDPGDFRLMFLIFNFFDLAGDMIKNNISLRTMFHLPVLPDARSDLPHAADLRAGGGAG